MTLTTTELKAMGLENYKTKYVRPSQRQEHHDKGFHFWRFVKDNLWQCEICKAETTSEELSLQEPQQRSFQVEFEGNGKNTRNDFFTLILPNGTIYTKRIMHLWTAWNSKRLKALGIAKPGDAIMEIEESYQVWKEEQEKNAEV